MVSLKGFDQKIVTFENNGASTGQLVYLSNDNTVSPANQNTHFIGVCVTTNGKYASVLIGGYVEIKYATTKPTLGITKIKPASSSTIAPDTAGENSRQCIVTMIDESSRLCGIIL